MTKKSMKRIGLVILAGVVIAGSIGAYLFFKPHRDVQATNAFAELKASELVSEFTIDAGKANAKYLASDGNSKVLIVEGRVSKISDNQNGEKVIVLKDESAKVGVSATFTKATTANTQSIKVGDIVHAILVQCDIVK
jgi:hypothetical protein